MKLRAIAIAAMLQAVFLSGCGEEWRSESVTRLPGLEGVLLTDRRMYGGAAGGTFSRVLYKSSGGTTEIFRGHGSQELTLYWDRSSRLLVVAFCGGTLDVVRSNFQSSGITNVDQTPYDKAGRVQIINNKGLLYKGLAPCG